MEKVLRLPRIILTKTKWPKLQWANALTYVALSESWRTTATNKSTDKV